MHINDISECVCIRESCYDLFKSFRSTFVIRTHSGYSIRQNSIVLNIIVDYEVSCFRFHSFHPLPFCLSITPIPNFSFVSIA